MSLGLIHVLQTADGVDVVRMQSGLLRHGLGLRMYMGVHELCEGLSAQTSRGEPGLVLLVGPIEHSCPAAAEVRRAHRDPLVVGVAPLFDGRCLQRALLHGIDVCWPAESPISLLSAGLQRLLRSSAFVTSGSTARLYPEEAAWTLTSRGWVVQSPEGRCIPLTSAERSLILALRSAPGQRLAHGELMSQIEALPVCDTGLGVCTQPPVSEARAARRLSVVVSRLRRKFVAAGVQMPIRSLHGRGYELTVQFQARDYEALAAV